MTYTLHDYQLKGDNKCRNVFILAVMSSPRTGPQTQGPTQWTIQMKN